MSFKRSSGCMLAPAMELPGSCDPSAHAHAHKRMCCGPSSFSPAPATSLSLQQALPPHAAPHPDLPTSSCHPHPPSAASGLAHSARLTREVQGFLHRLARTHMYTAYNALPEPNFSDAVWQCFGELNLDMEAYFPSLAARSIRGYHSFTRMPRDMLQQRYAASLQQPGQTAQHAHLWPPSPPLSLQSQMVMFILDKVFAMYPEAAVVQYTLELQPWLLPWCQRWGLLSHASPDGVPLVNITAVHGYAPGEQCIRAVYVPSFQQ